MIFSPSGRQALFQFGDGDAGIPFPVGRPTGPTPSAARWPGCSRWMRPPASARSIPSRPLTAPRCSTSRATPRQSTASRMPSHLAPAPAPNSPHTQRRPAGASFFHHSTALWKRNGPKAAHKSYKKVTKPPPETCEKAINYKKITICRKTCLTKCRGGYNGIDSKGEWRAPEAVENSKLF